MIKIKSFICLSIRASKANLMLKNYFPTLGGRLILDFQPIWQPKCKFRNFQRIEIVKHTRELVKRLLYSPSSLGLEEFIQSKENELRTTEDPDSFKNKLRESCNSENCLIFTSDVRRMTKLAESDDDIELLIKLIKRISLQDSVLFVPFKVGPDIMRCLYFFNKLDEALSLVKDNKTSPLFTQPVNFILLMNMLYTNNRHQEVIEVFKFVEGLNFIKKFPISLVNLLYASLYKLNTKESFEQGLVYWQEFLDTGLKPPLRSVHFFAMLALKQNHSFAAVELLSNVKPSSVGFNIQVMAYAQAQCYDQVFNLFQKHFFEDTSKTDYFVTSDTFKYLENLFEKSKDELICKKLQKLKSEIIIHKFYTEKDLDVFLCEEIIYHRNTSSQEKKKLNNRECIQRFKY